MRNWSTASDISCWTWKRSLTSLAAGNTLRAVSIMADDRSVVMLLTALRLSRGSLSRTALTLSVATPRMMAANAPFLPRADLSVSAV